MEEIRTDMKEPYIQGCYTASNDTELEYNKDKKYFTLHNNLHSPIFHHLNAEQALEKIWSKRFVCICCFSNEGNFQG